MEFREHEILRDHPILRPEIWASVSPPDRLLAYGRGDAIDLLEALPSRGLAVVGSRYPTLRSRVRLRRWISELSGTGLIILSGFARGIDGEAHDTALRSGLPTIAVLGAGFDLDYPRGHRSLRDRILSSGGLILTEYGIGTEPRPRHFPDRNRIIAALSSAVLVAEAARRSGALNTAKWAETLDRQRYAVPCSPDDPRFAGNRRLLDEGHALAFWGAHSLGATWLPLAAREPAGRSGSRGTDTEILLHELRTAAWSEGGVSVESLFEREALRNWSAARFHGTLGDLINRGAVVETGAMLTEARDIPTESYRTPPPSNSIRLQNPERTR